jgi:hypothetical protein
MSSLNHQELKFRTPAAFWKICMWSNRFHGAALERRFTYQMNNEKKP